MALLTIVVEEQHKEFAPTVPLEACFGLSENLASVDQLALLIQQIHVLETRVQQEVPMTSE
jgi:hypothetical protein